MSFVKAWHAKMNTQGATYDLFPIRPNVAKDWIALEADM